MRADEGASWSLSFDKTGTRLACGNAYGSIQVWDTTTGALLRRIPNAHDYVVSSLHFSPTSSRILASAGSNNQIHLWNVDSGEKIRSIAGCRFGTFSLDGRDIATARSATTSGSDDVLLVDLDSGALHLTISAHAAYISAALFCGGKGSTLASASHNGSCKVWDSSTGALLRTINLGNAVLTLAWGRDWVRDTQSAMAFAMGHHPRLGAGSQVLELEAGVVRMILDRV
jgi:WD40 repeat protein